MRSACSGDSAEDARRLVRLLKGIRAKVNLIPFNDWEGSGFQRPPLQRILAFQSLLLEEGIRTTVRWSKGEDIGAACGTLEASSYGGTLIPPPARFPRTANPG